jgi:hypothetical protein
VEKMLRSIDSTGFAHNFPISVMPITGEELRKRVSEEEMKEFAQQENMWKNYADREPQDPEHPMHQFWKQGNEEVRKMIEKMRHKDPLQRLHFICIDGSHRSDQIIRTRHTGRQRRKGAASRSRGMA